MDLGKSMPDHARRQCRLLAIYITMSKCLRTTANRIVSNLLDLEDSENKGVDPGWASSEALDDESHRGFEG